MGSFQPVYSWEKRKDDALMLLVRFGSLAITAVAIQQIAETHSLADFQDFVTSSYIDVLDWGVEKLTALPGSDRQALPSLDELQKQNEWDVNDTNTTTGTMNDFTLEVDADDDNDAE